MTTDSDFEGGRCCLRPYSHENGNFADVLSIILRTRSHQFHELASIHRHLDRFDLYQKINNVFIYDQMSKSMNNEGAHHG